MTDPGSPNMAGQQLELDDEGYIIGLAPPPPPVPEQLGTPITTTTPPAAAEQ